ncbi:hypothetical protein, partial [Nocardia brasiliensis]|uniref:hypothetical protein n=1 Tax=Nocardia brasiliensis TaxID=37326 RepID=UPI003D7757A2
NRVKITQRSEVTMAGSRRTALARSAKLAKLPMSIMARRVTATGRGMMTGASRWGLGDERIDKAAAHPGHPPGPARQLHHAA